MCWMRSSWPSRNADCVWETPPQTPIPAQPVRLSHTLRIISHSETRVPPLPLYLLDQLFCCSSFKTTHFKPLSCLCFPSNVLCVSSSSSSASSSLWRSFHCLNAPWLSSWERFYFCCRCLSCVLFLCFALWCLLHFFSVQNSIAFLCIKHQRVCSLPVSSRMCCSFRRLALAGLISD